MKIFYNNHLLVYYNTCLRKINILVPRRKANAIAPPLNPSLVEKTGQKV